MPMCGGSAAGEDRLPREDAPTAGLSAPSLYAEVVKFKDMASPLTTYGCAQRRAYDNVLRLVARGRG